MSTGRLDSIVTADSAAGSALELPAAWAEETFERGTYGPDGRDGVRTRFERDSMALSVVPVRYRCSGGVEHIQGLETSLDRSRRERTAVLPDVAPRTAFATVCAYQPFATTETVVVGIAEEAGDALAIALRLAAVADSDRELRRAVRAHRGELPPGTAGASVSDDDALAAHLAEEPDLCLFTGRPTASHRLRLPYRYVTTLEGHLRSPSGRVRFPSTVGGLLAAVSHRAWEDRGLDGVDLHPTVDRQGPGRYDLDEDLATALSGGTASAVSLVRLGTESAI